MIIKNYTDLAKAAYLACCPNCRLLEVLLPPQNTQKAIFKIECMSEVVLESYESKWDNPTKNGKPAISDARKYFFKLCQMRDRAISLTRAIKRY